MLGFLFVVFVVGGFLALTSLATGPHHPPQDPRRLGPPL